MDLLDYSWRTTGLSVACPQVLISFRLVDSQTQTITLDDARESAGRQVLFPNVVGTLTADERRELMEAIVSALLNIRQRRLGG